MKYLLSKPYTVLPINSFPEFWCAPRVWKGPTGNCAMFLHPTPQETRNNLFLCHRRRGKHKLLQAAENWHLVKIVHKGDK